jgi:hypothetical protein
MMLSVGKKTDGLEILKFWFKRCSAFQNFYESDDKMVWLEQIVYFQKSIISCHAMLSI